MRNYYCNSTEDIYWLSHICVNGSATSQDECVKYYNPTVDSIRWGTGIWRLLVGLVGAFGNFITLLAIPYAAKQKRYDLDKNFNTTTVYILNLAFIDFLHCLLFGIPGSIIELSNRVVTFGQFGCAIIFIGEVATIGADVLGLALIAVARCLNMVCNPKWDDFCNKKRNVLFLMFISWSPNLVSLLLLLFMESYEIVPGWNCEHGMCSLVETCQRNGQGIGGSKHINQNGKESNTRSSINVWNLLYMYSTCLPSIAILLTIISYLLIWYKVCQSKKQFVGLENRQMSELFAQREMKMTWTIFIIIALNILCWIPYYLIHYLTYEFPNIYKEFSTSDYIIFDVLLNICEAQYAFNFFLYVARHKQYRNAVLDALTCWKCRHIYNSKNNSENISIREKLSIRK